MHNKGIGSFFPTIDYDNEKFINNKTAFNPENKILFYTGRQAIKYVIELIKLQHKTFIIWLPEYYCKHVTEWLKSNYSNIKTYHTDPSNTKFIIKAYEFAKNNDVVIVNNFWGINKCFMDAGHVKIITIEDHSHGWLSDSCKNSIADYCITSLRKSLPIPLGGMAWSPKNRQMDNVANLLEPNSYKAIWDRTLNGMTLKRDYEVTGNPSLKSQSLLLVTEAELGLHENYNLTYLNVKHKKIIEEFSSINYLEFKSKNIKVLCENIRPNQNFEIITSNTLAAFGFIIHFKDKLYLEKIKTYLINNNIYPSLLWPDNKNGYGYYLNIHIDYRYTKEDMVYIANTLNNFI